MTDTGRSLAEVTVVFYGLAGAIATAVLVALVVGTWAHRRDLLAVLRHPVGYVAGLARAVTAATADAVGATRDMATPSDGKHRGGVSA